jgi:hypothetical protein
MNIGAKWNVIVEGTGKKQKRLFMMMKLGGHA